MVKLSPHKVRVARRFRHKLPQRILGMIMGVRQNTISRAQTRVTWYDVP